jgi:protein phosphatase
MTSLTPYDPAPADHALSRAMASDGATHRAACVRVGRFETSHALLELAAASSRGRGHRQNEDAMSALDRRAPVYVVADGVGGGALASRASREVVDCVHRRADDVAIDERVIRHALILADAEVRRSIAARTDALGAATVALCAAVDDALDRWLIGWVGDCRVYRVTPMRTVRVEPITRDDSYRHLAEPPPPGATPDDPARMVGNGAVGTPNVVEATLDDDQMLVLCSDGVHKRLEGDDIGRVLTADAPLVRRCTRLVALARARGSVDDATVLVVQKRPVARHEPVTARPLRIEP